MTSPSKRKGDSAELFIADWLTEHLGIPVRRMLGAGRAQDVGDLFGLTNFTAQVANWPHNTLGALRHKPLDCEIQQGHGGTPYGVTFLKLPPLPGGKPPVWRAVLTLDQFIQIFEALSSQNLGDED